MALRVLLADNSETIKKVIQLSLQDYAAQVRSVNIGIDVIDVAKSFQPDIIFADILLQKRNGYDVCNDIKNTPELSKTPVVLIWSGFMDLDQKKYTQVRADAALEKPFDSNDLRALITKLVPKVKDQSLSEFIETPTFAKSEYKIEPPVLETSPSPATPTAASLPKKDWNMDAFEDINNFKMVDDKKKLPDLPLPSESEDDFAQVPLNKVSLPSEDSTNPSNKQAVMSKKTNEFELDVPEEADFDGVTVNIVIPQDDITNTDFLRSKLPPPTKAATPEPAKPASTPAPKAAEAPKPAATASPAPMSEDQLELILRNYSREIIEKIVWKLVPDMAERIIREEIKRLIDEPEMKA